MEAVWFVSGIGEAELQKKVKAAGGEWDRSRKLRIIRYEKVTEPGIEDRCTGVTD